MVQIYAGSDSELVSWLDLDNLDSHHYPSDYKLSPPLTPNLKADSLQTRNFQTQYCELGSNLELAVWECGPL